ncbi:unnamed protein product [Thlaspi arvense]|uniref:Uncharacterized protein n=1 Tax=Thlaspi arvense TaxID=13288 RepID=A0AAU9SRC8_THLAR|nr:unnamed protein product [Thlaspi arvense]
MATTLRREDDVETQPSKESERTFGASNKGAVKSSGDNEIMSKESPNLTGEQKKVRDGYLFCCENFYSLPEMINYMEVNHGLPKTTVTNVFRELLTGRNAESYLRVSQKRALQRMSSGNGAGSSSTNKCLLGIQEPKQEMIKPNQSIYPIEEDMLLASVVIERTGHPCSED